MSCEFCSKPYEEHKTEPGPVVPRMPCLGLQRHYIERKRQRPSFDTKTQRQGTTTLPSIVEEFQAAMEEAELVVSETELRQFEALMAEREEQRLENGDDSDAEAD